MNLETFSEEHISTHTLIDWLIVSISTRAFSIRECYAAMVIYLAVSRLDDENDLGREPFRAVDSLYISASASVKCRFGTSSESSSTQTHMQAVGPRMCSWSRSPFHSLQSTHDNSRLLALIGFFHQSTQDTSFSQYGPPNMVPWGRVPTLETH